VRVVEAVLEFSDGIVRDVQGITGRRLCGTTSVGYSCYYTTVECTISGNAGTIYNHGDLGNLLLAQHGWFGNGDTRANCQLIMACWTVQFHQLGARTVWR
jgi:hypothetical protein